MGYPAKGRADYLELGSWNITCCQCGRKRKFEDTKQLPPGVPGAGLFACYPEHWDFRHPQEFVKAVPDVMTVPYAQPPVDDSVYSVSCSVGGTGDAIVLTPSVTMIGPFTGQIFEFTAAAPNTGAVTCTVLGATADVLLDYVACVAGDILAGSVYQVEYLQDLSTQEYYFALSS